MLTVPKVIQVCETKIACCLCARLTQDLHLKERNVDTTVHTQNLRRRKNPTCVISVYTQVTLTINYYYYY